MAACWRVVKVIPAVLCAITIITFKGENCSASPPDSVSIANDRVERVSESKGTELESVEEGSFSEGLVVPEDTETSREEVKPKNSNKLQKPIPNYNKSYSTSKVASNESFNEKLKPGPQGLKNSLKKDFKVVYNNSEQLQKSNGSSVYKHEKKKVKPTIDTDQTILQKLTVPDGSKPTMGVKVNETHLMSDEPVSRVHNETEDSDDEDMFDEFSQNTTNIFDDGNITTTADGRTMPSPEGLDAFMISGIVVGTVVLLGLAAGGGFAVYRHRLWNKPQTLSDKCSNADSSGYIDDSTLRENSEEMYSLDNDSFLNSLEAMTIQNYWTDNVKHTKL